RTGQFSPIGERGRSLQTNVPSSACRRACGQIAIVAETLCHRELLPLYVAPRAALDGQTRRFATAKATCYRCNPTRSETRLNTCESLLSPSKPARNNLRKGEDFRA